MLAGYGYAGALGEAASRLMHDFLHRERERIAAGEAEKGPRGPSIEDLLRLGASDLEQRCDQMAGADAALGRSRAELRRCRASRRCLGSAGGRHNPPGRRCRAEN